MHAIEVLDRTFLGDIGDTHYRRARANTITVVMNCDEQCHYGFCASMGTGPHLRLEKGYDIVVTELHDRYLLQWGSARGSSLVREAKGLSKAGKEAFAEKRELEERAIESFTRWIDTDGLPELLAKNLDHGVYKRVAEERCLGCANCTMVCPTCYCYDMVDETTLDLKTTERKRHWGSCQELNFAKVHGGNFRVSREARLRQFVTHKQYGCFGCVGCGRCMAWCPTRIDLTEMAKEIQEDYARGKAR